MMKKILVPTDFSKYANNALNIAFQWARKAHAEVVVLHVIPPVSSVLLAPLNTQVNTPLEDQYVQHIQNNAYTEIQKIITREEFPQDKVQIRVLPGNIHKTILKCIEKENIDMVVMGTQGTRPIAEVFVGSNTEKLVRFSPCPVLTVRDRKENFITAKILLATNLQDYNKVAFAKLKEIQRLLDAHLHLVFVNSTFGFMTSEEIELKKNHFILETGLENYTFHVISALTEEGGILALAKKLDVDMVTLLTQQRKGLAHFLLGSTAEDIVNHSYRPVLTLSRHMA